MMENNSRSSEKEILKKITESFLNSENLRAEGLRDIQFIHGIKDAALQKEHKRLVEKLGEAHPRVERIASRVRYNQGLFKELDSEIKKAEIRPPAFDLNRWMIHGFVRDKEGKPLKNVTVALYNDKGTQVKQIKHACSNTEGYYAVVYQPETEAEAEKIQVLDLFPGISDDRGRLMYLDPNPVRFTIGRIDYREFCMSDKGGTCTPPRTAGAAKKTQKATITKKKKT